MGTLGGTSPSYLSGIDLDEWRRGMEVNVTGTFLCSRAALPLLAVGDGGAIVNLSSILGTNGLPAFPADSASKGVIANLARQAAIEGGPLGVRANAVLPGCVDNDMGDSRGKLPTEDAAAALREQEAAAARQPILRQCSTAEVAAAAAILAGPDAFITGVLLPVDGGFVAQGHWRGPGS